MGLSDWKTIDVEFADGEVSLSDKYSVSGKYSLTISKVYNVLLCHKKYWGDIPEIVVTFWVAISSNDEREMVGFGPLIQYLKERCDHQFRKYCVNIYLDPGNKIEFAYIYYYEYNLPYIYNPWKRAWCLYRWSEIVGEITDDLKNIIGEKWPPGNWVLYVFKTDGSHLSLYISEPIEKPKPKEIPPLYKVIDNKYVTWYASLDGHKGLYLKSSKPYFIYVDDYKIYDP